MSIIEKNCKKVPKDFEKNINNLLNSSINFDLEVLSNINDIVKQLEKLLQDEDLLNLCVNVYSKDKEWYN